MRKLNRRLPGARGVGSEEEDTELNITSMMDMFTIILLFLLQAFSASPEIVTMDEKLMLPVSNAQKMPEKSTSVAITSDRILLNGIEIGTLESGSISKKSIVTLTAELSKVFRNAEEFEARSGSPFIREILIQAHRKLDGQVIQQLANVAVAVGFEGFRFLVVQNG